MSSGLIRHMSMCRLVGNALILSTPERPCPPSSGNVDLIGEEAAVNRAFIGRINRMKGSVHA